MLTHKSPNYTRGRGIQKAPIAIVVHIMEGTLKGTDAWFKDHASGVSAHYGIGRNGETHSYVKETDTAWHAGKPDKRPLWKNAPGDNINVNTLTIGIENEGKAYSIWTKAQKEANIKLIAEICKRWNIHPNRNTIIGHYEISRTRRPNCPAINKNILDELVSGVRFLMFGVK